MQNVTHVCDPPQAHQYKQNHTAARLWTHKTVQTIGINGVGLLKPNTTLSTRATYRLGLTRTVNYEQNYPRLHTSLKSTHALSIHILYFYFLLISYRLLCRHLFLLFILLYFLLFSLCFFSFFSLNKPASMSTAMTMSVQLTLTSELAPELSGLTQTQRS